MASQSIQRVADAAEYFLDGRLREAGKIAALRMTQPEEDASLTMYSANGLLVADGDRRSP